MLTSGHTGRRFTPPTIVEDATQINELIPSLVEDNPDQFFEIIPVQTSIKIYSRVSPGSNGPFVHSATWNLKRLDDNNRFNLALWSIKTFYQKKNHLFELCQGLCLLASRKDRLELVKIFYTLQPEKVHYQIGDFVNKCQFNQGEYESLMKHIALTSFKKFMELQREQPIQLSGILKVLVKFENSLEKAQGYNEVFENAKSACEETLEILKPKALPKELFEKIAEIKNVLGSSKKYSIEYTNQFFQRFYFFLLHVLLPIELMNIEGIAKTALCEIALKTFRQIKTHEQNKFFGSAFGAVVKQLQANKTFETSFIEIFEETSGGKYVPMIFLFAVLAKELDKSVSLPRDKASDQIRKEQDKIISKNTATISLILKALPRFYSDGSLLRPLLSMLKSLSENAELPCLDKLAFLLDFLPLQHTKKRKKKNKTVSGREKKEDQEKAEAPTNQTKYRKVTQQNAWMLLEVLSKGNYLKKLSRRRGDILGCYNSVLHEIFGVKSGQKRRLQQTFGSHPMYSAVLLYYKKLLTIPDLDVREKATTLFQDYLQSVLNKQYHYRRYISSPNMMMLSKWCWQLWWTWVIDQHYNLRDFIKEHAVSSKPFPFSLPKFLDIRIFGDKHLSFYDDLNELRKCLHLSTKEKKELYDQIKTQNKEIIKIESVLKNMTNPYQLIQDYHKLASIPFFKKILEDEKLPISQKASKEIQALFKRIAQQAQVTPELLQDFFKVLAQEDLNKMIIFLGQNNFLGIQKNIIDEHANYFSSLIEPVIKKTKFLVFQYDLIMIVCETEASNKQLLNILFSFYFKHIQLLEDEQFNEDLYDLTMAIKGSLTSRKQHDYSQYQLVFTDDYWLMFMCGTHVKGSCQNINSHVRFNQALLAYLCDGKNKMLAIIDQEKHIVGRAIVRLLFEPKTKSPVLFLERCYPYHLPPQLKRALRQLALNLAKQMNLPLLSKSFTLETSEAFPGVAVSLGCPASFEYVDALHKLVPQNASGSKPHFVIPNPELLYLPPKSYKSVHASRELCRASLHDKRSREGGTTIVASAAPVVQRPSFHSCTGLPNGPTPFGIFFALTSTCSGYRGLLGSAFGLHVSQRMSRLTKPVMTTVWDGIRTSLSPQQTYYFLRGLQCTILETCESRSTASTTQTQSNSMQCTNHASTKKEYFIGGEKYRRLKRNLTREGITPLYLWAKGMRP